ncbi:UNVERIFIED_CONTAM: hypothetical protein FKN15_020448 [Acipenser sinensis]
MDTPTSYFFGLKKKGTCSQQLRLTAFMLKTLSQVRSYADVQNEEIEDPASYLLTQQLHSGEFHDPKPIAQGPQRPKRGPSSSPNDTCHLLQARTGPSNYVRCPRGSPNDTCHLLRARSGPSDPVGGPGSSPNDTCHLASACKCPSDSVWGPSGSPNDICHLLRAITGPG